MDRSRSKELHEGSRRVASSGLGRPGAKRGFVKRRLLVAVVCAAAVISGASPAQATTFSSAAHYPVGPNPSHLAVADFNGDGQPDVVVANNGVRPDGTNAPGFNTVSVLLGAYGGTFGPAVPYTVGNNPGFVAVSDFNADGHMDVAVGSLGSQELSILLGNGDGTFQPAVAYAAGSRPRGVAAGDFNGDGRPDLAVANRDTAAVSVLLGRGDGTFAPPTSYPAGTSPATVVVADFNGDGRADVAVANQVSDGVSVLLGNGDGTFAPAMTAAAGDGSFGVAAGDLNADGRVDLITADSQAATVSVLLGRGDGSFQPRVAYAVGSFPLSVVTADMNGDGQLDVVAANKSSLNPSVSVLLGRGDGTLAPAVNFSTGAGPTVVAGDLNGDGRPDLVTANSQADSVSVLLNQARAVTSTSVASSASSSTYGQAVTFTAIVSGSDLEGRAPGGTVTFFDGPTALGTISLSSGAATMTTSALTGGTHQITAVYDGDSNFTTSTSAVLTQTVNRTGSTTAVSSSLNPSSTGQPVTFTATVAPGAGATGSPSGTVTFMDGATTLGSAPLSAGTATFSTSSLGAGNHTITAVYGGDANFSTSTSPALVQAVINRMPADRQDCFNDGWRNLTDDSGRPFQNQGDCVAFASRPG